MTRGALEEIEVEPAAPDDANAVRALLPACIPLVYQEGLAEPLASAVAQPSVEERVLVARTSGRALAGWVLFGETAGALGAGRVRALVVDPAWRRRGVGSMLLREAVEALSQSGCRLVMLELPADPAFEAAGGLIERAGFAEEARAPDLVRDGVALRFLRLSLTG